MKNNANTYQVDGDHYNRGVQIQHWDFAASQEFDYFQGQVTKYVTRWKKKNGMKDLEKALHFLQKYIEVEKAKIAIENAKKMELGIERSPMPPKVQRIDMIGQLHPFGFDIEKEILGYTAGEEI